MPLGMSSLRRHRYIAPAMANLLRIVLDLVEDGDARRAFRDDPHHVLAGVDELCAEDVAAAVDVVRLQVEPRLAPRLTEVLAAPAGHHDDPTEAARRSLLALCDAVESAGGAPGTGSHDVPSRPPGPDRASHLWAIDGDGGAPSRDHDRRSAVPLAPVPDPPGGFEFSPLELVRLPSGLPAEGYTG